MLSRRMRTVRSLVSWSILAGLGGSGCHDEVTPETPHETLDGISSSVDLLVMIDNSNSMAQEQANLTEEFQTMVDTLTEPTDVGDAHRPSVTDLHVGVVSSDMGTGGFYIETCDDNPTTGDDGILVDTSDVAGCEPTYPKFLTFAEGDDPAAIATDFACIATLGTAGCGYEQQLKAVRRALTRNAEAGAPNDGFLRESSLLAILMVTDEEDCSVYEGEGHADASDIFNVNIPLGPVNLRCFNHRDQYVEPVSSYVDDILALRPDDPERVVVAAIVGIPPRNLHQCNLESMADADFQCLLDLPAMQEVIDDSPQGRGLRLTPSCNQAGLGEAFPPRRIVDFVRQIDRAGNGGIVSSICDHSYQTALEGLATLIQTKVTCLARPLDLDPVGQVECTIQEHTTNEDACLPGRIDLGLSDGKRLCQICQEGDGLADREVDAFGTDVTPCAAFNDQGHFWHYLTGEQTGAECLETGKVEFLGDALPDSSSTVHLRCVSPVDSD